MIQKLTLRNFQAHKKLVIDFDPRITAIVGATDSGKSAIIRALTWICLNKPAGTGFIRTGQKDALGVLRVDGKRVKRRRGSKGNVYSLDGDEFKAFGNDVPDEVRQVLRLTDLNFQLQHDSPFWFSRGAGEVSRELNQIVDLGIIDSTLARVGAVLRKARATEEVCKSRLAQAEQEKQSTAFCTELDEDVAALEKLSDTIDDREESIDELSELIASAEQLRKRKRSSIPDLSSVMTYAAQLEEAEEKMTNLEDLLSEIIDAQEHVDATSAAAKRAEAELHKLTKGKCPICGSVI